ncbi:uncharacterized protein LOC103575420 [Microplitis demolitor]|uniref:uncharacterized protein LOC103575420 n=1 Tax=Microplitis demolitor TaxID=69319 RepID=UPI0004CCCECC|nr:uncharacterized protein LOC103575420 [Microplitis demolitor]
MWKYWILLLCSTSLSWSNSVAGPQSVSVNLSENNHVDNEDKKEIRVIRRFACPVGFFRLKRNCYYLSAGMAPWREAHFHCKDRNSTLAILDKKAKNRRLRKYLMGDQFTRLERWIGGIYNWQQMSWEWGVSGEKIVFQNFDNSSHSKSNEEYAWHCVVLDPLVKYKWSPRSCVEKKHYICQVRAGRIGRRKKKIADPNVELQNQREKPKKRGKKYNREKNSEERRRNKNQRESKRNWAVQNYDNNDFKDNNNRNNNQDNEEWAHGVNIGSRPPTSRSGKPKPINRTRHQSNKIRQHDGTPKITQIIPQGYEHGAFLGDGPFDMNPQSLSDDKTLSQYHNKINDLSLEEVLFKT